MTNLVTISPDIQSGEAVFAGTRVPVKNFFDYLRGGDSLDDFLKDFPSVRREQAILFLSLLQGFATFQPMIGHEKNIA